MAETSSLTRYRPATLALAAFAAACGIYVLYTSRSPEPEKSSLHRSNAVHRPRVRASQSRPIVEFITPNAEALLGLVIIRRGSDVLVGNLAQLQLPTEDQIRATFGSSAHEIYNESLTAGLCGIMLSCVQHSNSSNRQTLESLGLGGLSEALVAQDGQRCSSILAAVFTDVNDEIISREVAEFLRTYPFSSHSDTESDRDTRDLAETEDMEGLNDSPEGPSQGIKGLLYYIAEEQAHRKAYEHRGITCEECGENPIRGIRWHCLNCPDFDLCSTCEAHSDHIKTHVFAKIRIPLPVLSQPSHQIPIWYPGDPRKMHVPLDPSFRRRISQQYDLEEPMIDAYYEQFVCIANVPWPSDPLKVQAAIDKRAFDKALTSDRWKARFSPNILYDRMFAFYDSNNDGLVGFEEFVSGLAYLRGSLRFTPLTRALRGFDLDSDGFVDRTDFLRLFRAKYSIHELLVNTMVEMYEDDQSLSVIEVLRSSQPISSVFHEEEIPQGEDRPRRGKRVDEFGDAQPLPGTKTILDDNDPWPLEDIVQQHHGGLVGNAIPQEHIRYHLSRFEEMLYGTEAEVSGSGDAGHIPATSAPTRQPEQFPQGSFGSPGSNSLEKPIQDSSINQDVLLQVVEEGMNEMLDRIFKKLEEQHRDAVHTRSEREKWRKHIDLVVKEKLRFESGFQTAAQVDPLLATASYHNDILQLHKSREEYAPDLSFRSQMVPTDSESLSRWDENFSHQTVEEFRNVTGYGTTDEPDPLHISSNFIPQHSVSNGNNGHDNITGVERGAEKLAEETPDPTLPQNRPNTVRTESSDKLAISGLWDAKALEDGLSVCSFESPPSKKRLEYLASLDDADREITERGGPGKLSLEEVEAIALADTTKEIRGMIISWLDWASF